jgi:hypothetical protein
VLTLFLEKLKWPSLVTRDRSLKNNTVKKAICVGARIDMSYERNIDVSTLLVNFE